MDLEGKIYKELKVKIANTMQLLGLSNKKKWATWRKKERNAELMFCKVTNMTREEACMIFIYSRK